VIKLPAEFSSRLDLALWAPSATGDHVHALCAGALKINARAVCVPSGIVARAFAQLEDSPIKVVALTGFPLGNPDADVKRFEAEAAIDNGAHEIELVLNHGRLAEGDDRAILRELRDVVETADERPVCLSADCHDFARDQVVHLCHLALDAGISGISLGTGFRGRAPMLEHVKLVREATSKKFIIKAAPVAARELADSLVAAGVDRLGLVFDAAQPGA